MMKTISMMVMGAVLVACVVPQGEAGIGCGQVVQTLNPCIGYLTGPAPLGGCCKGVQDLNSMAKTTPDRQSVCNCLKSLSGSYHVDLNKASGLPGQCGITLPYKISPSIDCATVH